MRQASGLMGKPVRKLVRMKGGAERQDAIKYNDRFAGSDKDRGGRSAKRAASRQP